MQLTAIGVSIIFYSLRKIRYHIFLVDKYLAQIAQPIFFLIVISMEQLMDQLLVLQASEVSKYLEKSKCGIENELVSGSCEANKQKFTIKIDNPLLSKNW